MCGICGFNWTDKDLLKSMTEIIRHRGPDGGGLYVDGKFSLGQRRLSIIDLSNAGNMPMYNEDRSMLVVFNGEIYNFKELREVLEKKGHRFSSDSDTEVIIHGYEQWGEEVVGKLNGMFVFCIYDLTNGKLFLARDRLGIKPLYYYWNEDKFIFASEIKAILLASIDRQVNINAARNYLQLRYVPGEETLFLGIKKLLPGHLLVFDKGVNIRRFWDVPVPLIRKTNSKEVKKKVFDLLVDSVRRRLVADVPVGVYLSGGIDSAAITALAAGLKGDEEKVKTFSVGFGSEFDELEKAKKVSEHFDTEHHEILVGDRISQMLPKLIWQLDMPHGDPVIIPQFKLSELASQKVKVVLSGEGADEIFAGYVQYKTFLQAQKFKYVPFGSSLMNRFSVKTLDKFFDYPSSMGRKGKEKVNDFLENLDENEKAYWDLISIMGREDRKMLFTEQLDRPFNPPKFDLVREPLLNQLLYYDIKKWLPNYVLFINDRMTMANSIEGRVPFLDHRLVEYSTSLPMKYKLNGGVTKSILRQTMKGILPDTKVKKHAFLMPLDKWYKDELKDLSEMLFTPASVRKRGYFNYYYLKKIWENYDQSKLLYGKQLFTLLNFELWHKMFIDGDKAPKGDVKLSSLI